MRTCNAMRISLPFWARSPSYRRNTARRLQLNMTTPSAAAFKAPQAELASRYRRADFTHGPCYLPPDAPRQADRWRWERDPLVIGTALGFIVIGFALALLGGF